MSSRKLRNWLRTQVPKALVSTLELKSSSQPLFTIPVVSPLFGAQKGPLQVLFSTSKSCNSSSVRWIFACHTPLERSFSIDSDDKISCSIEVVCIERVRPEANLSRFSVPSPF
eukprot:TRINITY_DN14727_c1_g1_i1.p1 TRINITY_DN14727_c1_g1~~TRINITY_DN14727_c1_g1_i1.p1  ORF type:complete len:113 (+),score=14.06 TRINITY_DN14727_c1_g1_i1:438-776(+)